MSDKIWEPSEELLQQTRDVIEVQYKSNSVEDFIDNQVEVIASLHAEIRFLRRMLHNEQQLPSRCKDLKGIRFGRLLVLNFSRKEGSKILWGCRCDCGTVKETSSKCLLGGVKSCGCIRKEKCGLLLKEMRTTHGRSAQTEYRSWQEMKSRCLDLSHEFYKDYGGRGITVCDRWLSSFENFLEDMGDKPNKNLTLERIDNYGNYEPGNCKWATKKEQARNRRSTLYVKHGEERISLSQLCEDLGLNYKNVWRRYREYGWSLEESLK